MHFRLVAHLVHAEVIEHHPQSGSVCPGQFVYHYFYIREQDVDDLTWSFELHSGDVYYLTRHVHAPLKLTQPYGHADSKTMCCIIRTARCRTARCCQAYYLRPRRRALFGV